MAKTNESALEKPLRIEDGEDEGTLAAIDEGLADSKAGRTVPVEEVRELLPKWISASSLPKKP